MLIADLILLVVFAVLAVLVVAHHRAYHVDQAHLEHIPEDYDYFCRVSRSAGRQARR